MLVERACRIKGYGLLCLRKTKPEVKSSCWRLMERWLRECSIQHTVNLTDLTVTLFNGNKIYFDGIDDAFKKKSIEGINDIWFEEATEFTKREILQLNISCRNTSPGVIRQRFFTFNPVDPIGNESLYKITMGIDKTPLGKGPEKSSVKMVTFTDNPFLEKQERDDLNALADQDAEYDKIYRQGQWATPTHIIYTNWDIVNDWPERCDEILWGLDFGYSSNPAALIEVRVCGDDAWLMQHIYRTGLTNPMLIALMQDILAPSMSDTIVGDSAEPKTITEISNAGFNIHPCVKGVDSVRFGIQAVKTYKIHILSGSTDVIKEFRGYKWKQDRNGDPISPPVPLKFLDHSMDAIRYALSRVRKRVEAGISFV